MEIHGNCRFIWIVPSVKMDDLAQASHLKMRWQWSGVEYAYQKIFLCVVCSAGDFRRVFSGIGPIVGAKPPDE